MLSALHNSVDLIAEFRDKQIDLAMIPQEDEVYAMLCRADTVGVFQIESRAQMATLPRLKPRRFYDLVVEVALIRPAQFRVVRFIHIFVGATVKNLSRICIRF